ncbi:cyclin-like F-box containing protein [Heterostelium album PN500]|uniref:Cyclin-like F-box containing protein n=1 Tax=Heterostelium pallidum (strain ATCC 26659 / Pp 5 / PN500) TaxID=670386 RepID=D3B242_HETP5|nr:cyclin-like F-box containing protein [Heterostelium album PN500]EFA84417.1 cyclin-like F-box containing protein [Heterostelium album PN500]|eukprot:XP_020436531.1 cyclin-like F-box containing protein [Heterostelium album PN500]
MGHKLSKYSSNSRKRLSYHWRRSLNQNSNRSGFSTDDSVSSNSSIHSNITEIIDDKQIVDANSVCDTSLTVTNQKNLIIFRNLELINALNFDLYEDDNNNNIDNINNNNHSSCSGGSENSNNQIIQLENNNYNNEIFENNSIPIDNNFNNSPGVGISSSSSFRSSYISSSINNMDSVKLEIGKIQTISMELLLNIMSYLTVKEILTLQSVSKFWYMLIKDDMLWKYLMKRDIHNKWNYQLRALMSKYETQSNVNWKKIYCDQWRTRLCGKCSKTYRQCHNQNLMCKVHTGIRDIVENRGVPSGVYWLCCLAKPKNAEGCTSSSHHEDREIPNLSYYNC